MTFASYAYFYQGGGWNQNSRFDTVRAILEHRNLAIDKYHENTEDKALARGHYYSEKAPGLVLLAVPVAAGARPLLRSTGIDPDSPRGLVATSYLACVFSVGLPAALACICLFLIALELGSSTHASAFGALGMGLATPMWAYATLFWGHALAGSCLVFAFLCVLKMRGGKTSTHQIFWAILAGVTAGYATVTEYPALPASAMVAIFALATVWQRGPGVRWRVTLGVFAGALPCIAALMAYQYFAFGSMLHPGYTYYPPGAFPWMKRGFLGLTYPRIDIALKLLFGCKRGLLFTAPVIFAAPVGLRWMCRRTQTRSAAITGLAIGAYFFLFNASFASYAGGWSYGPRYLSPGVPLFCLGLAPAWQHAGMVWRRVIAALAVLGSFLALMAVSTNAQPDLLFKCPLLQLYWPSFWSGRLSQNVGSVLTVSEVGASRAYGAFNLGELMKLQGLPSLVPLLTWWSLIAVVWFRLDRRRIT
ncbi:MAG: hypothetical protein JOY93_12815 [Acidobacteriales bacterium]|nr:hypothetical protein [Terriglobales bacterium]